MKPTSKKVQNIYLILTLLSTLAASFIWGINTLFLLSAGLSNTEAFAANAFFTLGQVLFEVPTGVVADTMGRRTSYALGVGTLLVTTFAYFWLWQIQGPFWAWAVVSALLGLGFTFFSGATEAWLVDALKFTKFKGNMESVFGKAQSVSGVAMLVGSVSGGIIAQATNLGVPYILRVVVLGLTLIVCLALMKDWGFEPEKGVTPLNQVKSVLKASIENGLKNHQVRWIMLAAPFAMGVSFYIFYATQPYLLELYGDSQAYSIAGLTAAIIAAAQIVGGLSVKYVKRISRSRTSILIIGAILSILIFILLSLVQNFWLAISLLVLWGLISAMAFPIRQAYLNSLIKSRQRATVLSFDGLLGSSGGIATQPILGRIADSYGYATSFLAGSFIYTGSLVMLFIARKNRAKSDVIK